MVSYVVYVAGDYNMERFESFDNEEAAIECAKTLRNGMVGSIYVQKVETTRIFNA
jgi:hypothetical protein